MALAAVELTADCESCGLEGGVVEVYDALVPACRFGLPRSAKCKLCSGLAEGQFDRPLAKPMAEIPANRCPACLVELTPQAIDSRACHKCGAKAALMEKEAPLRFSARADLDRALEAWAAAEKFASKEALAAATFAEPDLDKLFSMLQEKKRIEIIFDPFANMGVKTVGGGARAATPRTKATPSTPTTVGRSPASQPPEPAPRTVRGVPPLVGGVNPHAAPPAAPNPNPHNPVAFTQPMPMPTATAITPQDPPHSPSKEALGFAPTDPDIALAPTDPGAPVSAPPRAIIYPLVSVIAADGEIHPQERELIDRFLKSEGLPALSEEEFRVHHPSEVAHFVPVARREDVVKMMCETAAVDGMPDESERRVIRAYATAWHVDDEKLDFWMWGYESMNTSLTRGLWMKLRRFVLSARWSEASANNKEEE
jgi:uncharacterized tellurite resistance protein B-like protein